jgi:hypothetical protein
MLPAKPLSQLTEEEILTEIRAKRAARILVKERVVKTRVTKRTANDLAVMNVLDQINAMIAEESDGN